MLINPIASGSSGNAYYISDGQSNLLLDAGIPLAQIQAGCGYKVSQLSGCLVTHGHGDHVKAAKALARMGVNIYTSQGTAAAAGCHCGAKAEPPGNIPDILHGPADPANR